MNITALVTSVLFLLPTSITTPSIPRQTVFPKPAIIQMVNYSPQKAYSKINVTSTPTKKPINISSKPFSSPPQIEKSSYYIAEIPLAEETQHTIYKICKQNKVDYPLIMAMLKVESNFSIKEKYYNKNGTIDYGIAQINSGYMKHYAEMAHISLEKFDPFCVEHAIKSLCGEYQYLRSYYLTRHYSEKKLLRYILNGYNMGPTGFDRFVKRNGTISRYYDQTILELKDHFQKLT